MGARTTQGTPLCLVWAISIAILMTSSPFQVDATKALINRLKRGPPSLGGMNVIDRCWRTNPNWSQNRHQLATCSVGYSGKMTGNIGPGLTNYVVTDPSDNPTSPKPGTLRYGTTSLKGKVWITFQRDMLIKLAKPLLVGSFTTIDARGADVQIAHGGCLMLQNVNNVIIHGLRIHSCVPQQPGPVMGPNRQIVQMGLVDGDALRMLGSSKIWIDHNTLYDCHDGLVDVTRGSTDITITNNWFKNQDKVMLLGHDDMYKLDKNMKVTVAFNSFGPRCNQRMPRVRFGYAHVVNNLYQGWGQYAIGGSMNPSIKSQANLFIAPGDNKQITWDSSANGNFRSVNDVFENGASFKASSDEGGAMRPNYRQDQAFPVEDGRSVRSITNSAGALTCPKVGRC